jgi:hypothetical protein
LLQREEELRVAELEREEQTRIAELQQEEETRLLSRMDSLDFAQDMQRSLIGFDMVFEVINQFSEPNECQVFMHLALGELLHYRKALRQRGLPRKLKDFKLELAVDGTTLLLNGIVLLELYEELPLRFTMMSLRRGSRWGSYPADVDEALGLFTDSICFCGEATHVACHEEAEERLSDAHQDMIRSRLDALGFSYDTKYDLWCVELNGLLEEHFGDDIVSALNILAWDEIHHFEDQLCERGLPYYTWVDIWSAQY